MKEVAGRWALRVAVCVCKVGSSTSGCPPWRGVGRTDRTQVAGGGRKKLTRVLRGLDAEAPQGELGRVGGMRKGWPAPLQRPWASERETGLLAPEGWLGQSPGRRRAAPWGVTALGSDQMAVSPLLGCPCGQGKASHGGEGAPGGPDLRLQLRALWPQKD